MASWGQMGAGTRAVLGVGGAVAVTAAGAVAWWLGSSPPPVQDPVPVVAPTEPAAAPAPSVQPEAQPAAKPDVQPAAQPEVAAEPAHVADSAPVVEAPAGPTLDLVRVEADGAAQVAGRAAPGARVILSVDAAPVAEAEAGGDGSFVALFTLAPNPQPSLLSLVMKLPDGTEVAARETVALAPIAGPQVAVAEPLPEAEPVPTAVPEPTAEVAAVAEPTAEPAPPAALLVTEEGVKVLQTADPAPVDLAKVSIDTIAYTPEGAVQFGGRGAVGQAVRLYLDNAALAEAAVPEGGQWTVTRGDIAPGIYTLRADQVDTDGKVTSRFETPFKRETIEALAAAAAPAAEPPAVEPAAQTIAAPAPGVASAPEAAPEPAPVAGPEPAPAPVAETEPAPAPAPEAAPTPAAPPEAPAADVAVAPEAPVQTPKAAATPEPAPAAVAAEPAPDAIALAAPPAAAPTPDPLPLAAKAPVTVTVQPGFTLWAIAREQLGEGVMYVQVYEANKDKIRDPDLIYPGQVFTVPAEP